ncbi:MAG: hypothetical protein JWO98_5104, partial [Frankiales bacterium]|nr:hypothetical protein [Frankiales bacterium]
AGLAPPGSSCIAASTASPAASTARPRAVSSQPPVAFTSRRSPINYETADLIREAA